MNTSQVIHVLNFFYDHADERIRDKFLMGSPYAIIFIYVTYVLIILKILPRFFEDRKPLNYQKIITCLDVVLTMRSSYFLIHGIYLWFYVYDWVCQPNDKSGSWLSDLEVELSHQFVISEFLLIFQSVVCVICKKNDSVATYMLVHHSVVPILLWFGTNYYPGGHGFFLGWVNSIEHTVSMTVRIIYVGFNLTCIKNYVKQFFMCTQILQFLTIFCHSTMVLFLPNCSVPKLLVAYEISGLLFIVGSYYYLVLRNAREIIKKPEKKAVV